MERRGFTLIELLMAIAILAVIMALALPAVENRLSGAKFEAAGTQLEAAVLIARTEAQRRGTTVSLVARPLSRGETGLFLEATPGAAETTGASEIAPGPGVPTVVLGSGVSITSERPGAASDRPAAAPRARAARADSGSASPLLIARFLPDGSAIAPGPVYLASASEAGAIVVNRWTGSAKVRPVALVAGGADEAALPEAPPGDSTEKEPP